jgi:bla regulator protein BlaR1
MASWVPSELLNHLWQSTLFVALVWLATLALRRNRARVRYWLWMVASIKFLVPVSGLVSVGEQFAWNAHPASVQPAVSFVMEEILTPAAVAAVPLPNPHLPSVLPWLLVAVWCGGVALVLGSWWRHWLPVRSALRRATPVQLDAQYDAADLAILSSPSMWDVGVVGIRHPVLLFPEGLTNRLVPAQFQALIAHERCHIRCHDNLFAAVHVIIEALFWFHPLVWWIEARLVDERERACDEAVLRAGNEPGDYATGILEVCQYTVRSRLSWVAGISGSNLRRRVESIMRSDIGRPMSICRLLALGLAVVAVIGVPVVGGGIKKSSPSWQNSTVAQQQSIGNGVTFEVASIRANKSGRLDMPSGTKGRLYTATNIPLRNVIAAAYGMPAARVLGGPSWIGAASIEMRFIGGDRFDISAKLPEDTSADQVPAMLRALLADRFKLIAHSEIREATVYALVVARNDGRLGPQLRKASIDCEAAGAVLPAGPDAATVVAPELKTEDQGRCQREIGGEILGRGQRLSGLARMLSLFADRPVIDRTGLTGGFDFELRFLELATAPDATGPRADPITGIFAAVQEQLGLKLESIRGNLEFIIIDSVEHPTEN